MPIADVQGVSDLSVLRKLYFLFDIFIIHYFKEDSQNLEEEIRRIQSLNNNCKIIKVEHDE